MSEALTVSNSFNGEPLEPLTPEHIKAIAFIESYYYMHDGKFPTRAAFHNQIPSFDINAALQHKTFRISLMNRGIDPPVGPLNDDRLNVPIGLTKEQLAAIVVIVNFEDKRSRTTKLKDLGITPSQWQGWLKQKAFRSFLLELSGANLQYAEYIANEALVRAMDRNDINAVKFYHELNGRYKPASQTPQAQNIRIILARVIEAIQRHISDASILQAIGEDFEAILNDEIEPSRRINGQAKEAKDKEEETMDAEYELLEDEPQTVVEASVKTEPKIEQPELDLGIDEMERQLGEI